jgi:hypothetical protein
MGTTAVFVRPSRSWRQDPAAKTGNLQPSTAANKLILLPMHVPAGAGKSIVDNCMGGYNSSIFAYGQTGAGKTYTMQGPLSAALQDDNPQVWHTLKHSSSEQETC